MPGITFLNRRWNFASDDLFYPGLIELISRTIWFTPQLFYYVEYRDIFKCPDTELLHIYYLGFLGTMTMIIFVQFWIVIISAQGTITNSRPRRHMVKFLHIRTLLILVEIAWSIVGTVWLANIKMVDCHWLIYFTVVANLSFCGIAVFFLIIVIFVVFDPLSHLDEKDVARKRNVLNYYINKMCCCFYCCLHTGNSRQANYENSYKQISAMLEMIFRNGDLTPSDIAAGIILINNKEVNQYKRESKLNSSRKQAIIRRSMIALDQIPKWMDINEASYFIRYALATYSWPYYLYMHNIRGFCDLCCVCSTNTDNSDIGSCCDCFKRKSVVTSEPETNGADKLGRCILHGDTRTRRNLRAFKFLSKTDDCDIVYANFQNELFLVPFCVLIDHFKKTVVITIRGTLSMRDVITDMTAECGYFDVDDLKDQPCHIGILNTAMNIYRIIKDDNLLVQAFRTNPNYQLTVTGHSLGAGTATILALKLRSEYPNIKCIAYSPPGGLISEALSDYTKQFVMSVIVGDDIVPRLSLHTVHNLKADILKEIYKTTLPKYKIIWKYSLSFVRQPDRNEGEIITYSSSEESIVEEEEIQIRSVVNLKSSPSKERVLVSEIQTTNHHLVEIEEEEISIDTSDKKNLFKATSSTIAEEAPKKLRRDTSLLSNLIEIEDFKQEENEDEPIATEEMAQTLIKKMKRHVKETYPKLVLPGNILYIYQIDCVVKKSCCHSMCSTLFCCFDSCQSKNKIDYDSRWAYRDEFNKIIITNRTLLDHFPNQVDDALNYFHSTRRYV